MEGNEGNEFDARLHASLSQLHEHGGLLPTPLRERVLEDGARIAHRVTAHALRAVDVSESHVVERVKDARVHIVHAAQGQLRVATLGRDAAGRHELVRHGNVAHQAPLIINAPQVTGIDCHAQGVRVVRDLLVWEIVAHGRDVQVWNGPHVHRATLVRKAHGLDMPVVHRSDMNPLATEKAGCVGHALRGVVVAGDDHGLGARCRQALEEPVHERHGLGAGHGLVIQVPGDKHRVNPALAHEPHHLRQHVTLVLQHGELADALAYVQVRDM